MKNRFLKLCSMLLVIVLLANMLPMSIFAQEYRESLTQSVQTGVSAEDSVDIADVQIVDEIPEKRTKYTKEFLLSNGLHLATVYADAVHYESEDGWKEIDNTLKLNKEGNYSNTAGVWDVRFPQSLTGEKAVAVTKDGYTLSFRMTGELGGILQAGKLTTQEMPLKAMNPTVAKPQSIDLTATKAAAEHPETVPEKQHSQLKYERVYEKTDVVYDLIGNQVKESIILESYRSDLQGYRYALEVGDLMPVLEGDGQITLYAPDQETVVMVMPAPYLQDALGEYCGDVQVGLIGKGSSYVLTYLLPQQWLAEQDRAWPVILDPIVQADLSVSNIKDQTVSENKVHDNNWGMMEVGHREYGLSRIFLKYADLPDLTSSDVVVDAAIQLVKASDGLPAVVNVHKVNATWEANGLTWANMPGFNTTIEDYVEVEEAGYYNWYITDIVRDWYANANTGMMFKASDDVENAQDGRFKQFYSSDWGTLSYRPTLYIAFRNNNGLESYWDYTSTAAGRAGTGHINNYTGNLTWVREDIGFGGNRMPVNISHTYNLNDAIVPTDNNNSNNSGGNSFGMGIGWRTNFNQLVYRWNLNDSYYIWEDADGTDHYFKYESSGKYTDEDGLELTLTTTGSGSETYCIADKNGNCSYFDTYGRLSKISNNQQTKSNINITYYSTSRLITCITDGVGRRYLYMYNNGILDRIDYMGSGSTVLSHVSYSYTGTNLTGITDADGKTSQYTYSGSILTTAKDIDGYAVTYSYYTPGASWQPYRVKTVEESDGSAKGGWLTLSYGHNQTTFTDHNENKEYHQFNDFGNTTCILDDEGRAQYAQFAFNTDQEKESNTDPTKKGNQLRLSSKLQNTVANRLRDPSFEENAPWSSNSSSLTLSRTTEDSYCGAYSLKLVSTTENTVATYGDSFYVEPGATYIFSAYVKNVDSYAIMALQYSANYSTYTGDHMSAGQGWERLQVSYTNNTSESQRFRPILFLTSAGTVYMDGVQVEKTTMPSRLNLLKNGDFRHSGTPAHGWGHVGLTSNDGVVTLEESATPQLDPTVMKVQGNPGGYKQLMTYVECSGNAGDSYVLSAWAKGNSVPLRDDNGGQRDFYIKVGLNNYDGTTTTAYAKFNTDSDLWQYAATAVVAEKRYHSIAIVIAYNFNANTVYFDGIQLFKEEFGNTYTYDDKGNVISVRDLQAQTTSYEYDTNSNLTKILQNNKAKVTYTYDSYHNVKTATTQEGQVYQFAYDAYGNNTSVSITGGGSTIASSAVYSSDGNRLEKATDALGKETLYGYNANTNVLEWVQYPEDTAQTRTEYTYDAMYRMAEAACTTDTGSNMSATYSYTDDLLTGIETASTAYSFTYGDFGLRTAVKIGSRTLAEYTYTNDRNRYLQSLDYGNGDSVEYTYDNKGRVTSQTYEDGDTVTYTYDNNGALAKMTDSATGITTTYYYDSTERMMKYVESASGYSHSVGYTYDSLNNLTRLVETIDGVERTTDYTYDDDNRVESVSTDGVSHHYTYDSFGRVSEQTTKHNGTDVLTKTLTFQSPGAGKTSGQVATYTIDAGNYDVTYTYTYDDNGNITSIFDGTYMTSYEYDSANQLIRENNEAANRTSVRTYDDAGNVIFGNLSCYSEDEWGDLLTKYGGFTQEHDAIGNLLSDMGYRYTWCHGRQLETVSAIVETYTYTYNADGMRIQRTDGNDTYTYTYNGSQLVRMTKNTDTLYFTYDASGTPSALTYNGTVYYYVTNLQGDVVAILDSTGTAVATYSYNAWGQIIGRAGSMASTLGTLNPLRYRGYVYDEETYLYYLESRYYNPEMGRFINADGYTSTGQGILGNNMFAYCGNNPVMLIDSSGSRPIVNSINGKETKKERDLSFAYMNKRDITTRLNEEMKENTVIFSEYCDNHNYVESSLFFANQVKPGGDWDLKSQTDWTLKSNTTYIYNDTELRYDDVGNIHYGYVGKVLYSTDILLLMGGVVQIYTKTSSWSYWDSNFDDPRDQWAIQFGCNLWDSEAL